MMFGDKPKFKVGDIVRLDRRNDKVHGDLEVVKVYEASGAGLYNVAQVEIDEKGERPMLVFVNGFDLMTKEEAVKETLME